MVWRQRYWHRRKGLKEARSEHNQILPRRIKAHSPGLPRFAATLGNGLTGSFEVQVLRLSLEGDVRLRKRRNPVVVGSISITQSQGSRAARQPRAVRLNRFAVVAGNEVLNLIGSSSS